MKVKKVVFIILIVVDAIIILFLFLTKLKAFKFQLEIDSIALILLSGFIGLPLLLFADKIKIGDFFEFEAWKEKLDRIAKTQYLGEVLASGETDEFYYFDHIGLHKLLDSHTKTYLQTPLGVIIVPQKDLEKLPKSYPISVKDCRLIGSKDGTMFIVVNNRKIYIDSWSKLIDGGFTQGSADILTDEEIRAIPSAR